MFYYGLEISEGSKNPRASGIMKNEPLITIILYYGYAVTSWSVLAIFPSAKILNLYGYLDIPT